MHALQDELTATVDGMHATAGEFKRAFMAPWPAHLTVQRQTTGAVYLRWRREGRRGDQPYVQLEGDAGAALLRGIDPLARRVYLRFARRAADLNLAHSLTLNELRRLKRYVAQLEALAAVRNALVEP